MKVLPAREEDWSFDVRVHGIRTYKGARRTSYTVRWVVAGRTVQQTFTTTKLADGYRSQLLVAARSGEPFHVASGLPQSMMSPEHTPTWLEHCVDYVHSRWRHISPHHRKSLAETLTGVSVTAQPAGRRSTRRQPPAQGALPLRVQPDLRHRRGIRRCGRSL